MPMGCGGMTLTGENLQNQHSWNELNALIIQMKEFLKESEMRSRKNKEEAYQIRQELEEVRQKLSLLL